ncbi:hypothetical protein NP233_g4178 [Leucocoprinus birnbaumii]|uniref:Uncharacterized protein n=1 Tax=Leucocoprinus birnbaumii TaxID=56174 RepID=A0AAD5YXT2_9AGAR|nr:hypothetical protein NP233_g4178 [Leucocoprinus birnbaumii]
MSINSIAPQTHFRTLAFFAATHQDQPNKRYSSPVLDLRPAIGTTYGMKTALSSFSRMARTSTTPHTNQYNCRSTPRSQEADTTTFPLQSLDRGAEKPTERAALTETGHDHTRRWGLIGSLSSQSSNRFSSPCFFSLPPSHSLSLFLPLYITFLLVLQPNHNAMPQRREGISRIRLHNDGPEFPHSWTFSDQRYVPRPRPVARINLPSHQRSHECLLPDALSPTVTLSHSESMQPLLKPVHEREDVNGSGRSITFVQRLVHLHKRVAAFVNTLEKRIMGTLKVVWLNICAGVGRADSL